MAIFSGAKSAPVTSSSHSNHRNYIATVAMTDLDLLRDVSEEGLPAIFMFIMVGDIRNWWVLNL